MRVPLKSGNVRIPNETMRLIITTFGGVIFGFFLGIISPKLSSTKINLTYIESKYHGLSTQALFDALNPLKANKVGSNKAKGAKIWTPTNPKGAETLPPGIVSSRSDIYPRRLWGHPDEDLTIKPKYLVAFTVGYNQKDNIDAAVKKFSNNFTIVLFHYDGVTSEWDEFEWSKRAIHRFLHPDIVAPYDYIFIWDEDLGVEHFNAEEYIKIVRKHGLEISQPGLDPDSIGLTWAMTMKRNDTEIHTRTQERTGWCTDLHLPPCAAFVEIMATVFSRNAWRCVWHMIQNDLVHGWGLDFYLRRCVETPHEKIGVVDAQWIVHQGIPSLRNQTFSMGQEDIGLAPWKGVRERCKKEWSMFQNRMTDAEKAYYESMGISTTDITYGMDPSDFRR
ncbi:hypothetical protein ES319_D07G255300v1 [Gossypium barbadense]|uniref:Uncharacterized protein n=1 Tax=Gossypium barbadense TaxID=3634 RepID=A0A5J5QWY2_GOSBA|nr:hypothetical protein ES319_D07G255300v1 [Gossypium barbadense]